MGAQHIDTKRPQMQQSAFTEKTKLNSHNDADKAPASPSESVRNSFSSVREREDVVQTFVRTKLSSYEQAPVFDETPSPTLNAGPFFQAPATNPDSRLLGSFYPDSSFKGWREIQLKGRTASRSCENLARQWESATLPFPQDVTLVTSKPAGRCFIQTLPYEILRLIFGQLLLDVPPNGLTTRNADLMALLVTSQRMHEVATSVLYEKVTIPHSRIFRKFLSTIDSDPSRANIIRRLDFSHFNPYTMFLTASERSTLQNLTAETLKKSLDLMPHLQEFLAQEHIDHDLSAEVLQKLLFELPYLQAVDFCGCSTLSFKNAFNSVLQIQWPDQLSLRRISLHKCFSLPPALFETLLPRLPRLTHLDVAGTHITDTALLSIPHSAKITHLNLANCHNLSSEAVIKFITTHPAVIHSLQWLSLATNSRNQRVVGSDDVGYLISQLPTTLVSLNLTGSPMDSSHLPQLQRLSQTLEELSLGFGLCMADVCTLFRGNDNTWKPHNLRYLGIAELEGSISIGRAIFSPRTSPLLVVEIDEGAHDRMLKLQSSLERDGWTIKFFERRYWLVRMNGDRTEKDAGWRNWKMGSENWGMRKVPVAVAEVGGMYGSFMFGRRL